MRETVDAIDVRAGRAEITDNRLTMSAREPEGTLYVRAPENRPLGEGETHVTLALSGDDFEAEVELTADGLDELAAAIDAIRGRDDR